MTPVESTSAVRGGRLAACSAAWAMARAAASPSDPVQALATRAFIATARMRPGRSASRSASYTTGAAAAKPRGDVTEPSDTGSSIGGQDSPRGSLVKPFAVSYHSATFPGGPFDVGTVPQLRRLRRTRASALQ